MGSIATRPQGSDKLLALVQVQIRNMPEGRHEPTSETHSLVRLWAEVGASRELIARELRVDAVTLEQYYADDMTGGAERGVANVAAAMYERALAGDVAAQTFFLKARGRRAGWVDRDDDKPNIVVQLDLVKAIEHAFAAAKAGKVQGTPPAAARTIEYRPAPNDDGRDLL